MDNRNSLKNRILHYISSRDYWINGGEIERLAMDNGYKGSTASRVCRTLYNDREIDRKYDGQARSVFYKKLNKTF